MTGHGRRGRRPRPGGPWAIVLAGGDGTRLRPLVDQLYTDGRPKQFASLIGPRSLLRTTLDRVGCFALADRTVVVTVERYRAIASAELERAGHWTLEQPANRGTAAAILLAAMCIEHREADATVVVVPSDHHFGDDREVAQHLLGLSSFAASDPDRILLLGAQPGRPDTGYGWIEPGRLIGHVGSRPVREIRRFVEKPTEAAARAMLQRGWLWSTFMLVGRAATLAAVGRAYLPSVQRPLERAMAKLDGRPAEPALRRAYSEIRAADFSRDLLELIPERLGVSVLGDLEWSDLGTPERVLSAVRASARLTAAHPNRPVGSLSVSEEMESGPVSHEQLIRLSGPAASLATTDDGQRSGGQRDTRGGRP